MHDRSHLASAEWLSFHLEDESVVVCDVRWYIGVKTGREAYDAGHIPGAHFVDLDEDLSKPAYEGPGRHPLPSAGAFSGVLSRLGIRPDSTVVAYDDRGGAIAARLWWMLRHYGFRGRAKVLDGGIQGWVAYGGALERGTPEVDSVPIMRLERGGTPLVDKNGVQSCLAERGVVLDARSPGRYRGDLEPIDGRPGHIPGAHSAPYAENLQAPEGPLRPLMELERRYARLGALGDDPVVCYCGSGVTACHDLWTLAVLGQAGASLYEGSWSDWSRDEALPAATGDDPG